MTFGHVSRIREHASGCPIIQHDAPLNPGNSGGALFVELEQDSWYLDGVNYAKVDNAEGLGFAFALTRALANEFVWAPASPEGAATLIERIYATQTRLAR